ncbi:hypothetical protein [Nostoc sp. UHCC 0252]|uniref:hypothetical protein n=1 Tax=Nostoc sp. UHCC 0252 TaxID=3110241 RepID=UPI002B1F4A9A|nr:hypothetical protein [Nostoc sp. UHCC 0252]MEA5604669.1 hypothetical protein [Nostoc sp. UHCC 0252]
MIPFHEKSDIDVRRESFAAFNCELRIANWYEALFTSEGITIRSKARLLRMEKLKMASLVGENPGFEFLQECWSDDPVLQIVIKKLLAEFPQWGVAIVDGVLMKWND